MPAPVAFPAVYLLHGKGGSPEGSVLQIEALLRRTFPHLRYIRPSLPHGREKGEQPVSQSLEFLRDLQLDTGALVVGLSLGGFVGAKLQEMGREDLHVICISSPTFVDAEKLEFRKPQRVALYSSLDKVIAGRTKSWPHLAAESYDLPWLSQHDPDPHRERLSRLIVAYMTGLDLAGEVERIAQ